MTVRDVYMLFSGLCLFGVRRIMLLVFLCVQAEDGIRDLVRSRGLGDVYKIQAFSCSCSGSGGGKTRRSATSALPRCSGRSTPPTLSLIHI